MWSRFKLFLPACVLAIAAAPLFAADARPQILLGMSTALTGPAANLGADMQQGVLAGLERANRAGGVHGYDLRLISLDDGYEPARTAPNMRQLLEKDNVLAVIGNVGTPTAIAAVPIANEEKTLFFAGFTGAGVLRKNPPDRYVINYRASYAEETGAIIAALIDRAGLKPRDIAFFTQRDGYGDAGFEGGIAALGKLPVNVIVTQVVPYPLGDELQIVRDYQADLRAVDPNAVYGFGSLEGYIDARIFVAGLEKSENPPTREGIVSSLENMGQFDLGLGQPLSLSSTAHQACHSVWPTILRDGAFVPFDWKNIADLLKGSP